MAKLLTTGGGTQLVTGGGVALSADAKIVSVGVAAMALAFGLAASPAASASPSVSPMVVEFGLSAVPSSSGGVAPLTVEFGLSASATAHAHVEAAPSDIVWSIQSQAYATRDASVSAMPVALSLSASPTAVAYTTANAGPMGVGFSLEAQPSVPVTASANHMWVWTSLSATATLSRAEFWRSIWLNAYATRQTVLNAIDANNRFLAKQAGQVATATADALVVTNTNVSAIDGRVTAEAERTTLLTTQLQGFEAATNTNLQTLNSTVTSQGGTLISQGEQLNAVQGSIGNKADVSVVNALTGRVEQNEQGLISQGQQISAVQGSIGNKADVSVVNALTGRVEQNEQGLISQGEILSQVRSEVAGVFTADYGWEFSGNHRGFTGASATLVSFPVTENNGATVVSGTGAIPQIVSPEISLGGNGHPVIRAMVRRRTNSTWSGLLYWRNANHGFSGTYTAFAPEPPVGVWTVIEWDLRGNADWRSGPIQQLVFELARGSGSLVDVQWIALGNYGAGRAAQATQNMQTTVDTASNIARAVHGVVLTVDGKISGTRSENDGTRSSFDVLADVFRVTGSPVEGMEWQAGYLRVYGPTYQFVMGTGFGTAGNLVQWFGPNIGAAACSTSNCVECKTTTGATVIRGSNGAGSMEITNTMLIVRDTANVARVELGLL